MVKLRVGIKLRFRFRLEETEPWWCSSGGVVECFSSSDRLVVVEPEIRRSELGDSWVRGKPCEAVPLLD